MCLGGVGYIIEWVLNEHAFFQYDPFAEHRPPKIADREDEYKKHRRTMIISPERLDPFADGNSFPLFHKHSKIYFH